ncbi:Wadjet anti-phage system protein JetD domain-containing protein [Sedimenticola thiotaurini]|uniref:Wadjet anti-phage system protein JetD domain-containing protein n=1 Tax=Sedimenticola thiotaurini TaxID=1543721 RepID=UPI0006994B89|nr:Wadjet anti-phage system protein JetD domain-containing protein [Sedimenticola thiotaurini]
MTNGQLDGLPVPPWLHEEPEIRDLLDSLLTRLDKTPLAERKQALTVRLSKKHQPNLFKNSEASDCSWGLLMSLSGVVLTVTENPKRKPFDPVCAGATVRLLAGAEEAAEALLRRWLDRPCLPSYSARWAAVVAAGDQLFPGATTELIRRVPKLADKTPRELLSAFVCIGAYQEEGLTLRQLSARCFWGNSKFLDSREDLVRSLFPQIIIAPRPVIIHVYLPAQLTDVLFIENQDTYLQTAASDSAAVDRHALIYVSGFKGAAARIRDPQGALVHFHAVSDPRHQKQFLDWWFSRNEANWPVWFWGDLDFSGFMILKALRGVFGDVSAWPAGYLPMLDLLAKSAGHSAENGNKGGQIDPGDTGCAYADGVLLPALRSSGLLVDQEAVSI